MAIALEVSRGLPLLCSCTGDGKLSSDGSKHLQSGRCIDYSNTGLISQLPELGWDFIYHPQHDTCSSPPSKERNFYNLHFLTDMENSSVICIRPTSLQTLFCFPHSSLWTFTYILNTWVDSI